jgi:hypothetical protein
MVWAPVPYRKLCNFTCLAGIKSNTSGRPAKNHRLVSESILVVVLGPID